MRKIIIALCLIGSGIIILHSFSVGEAITLFMLSGSVPGTSLVLTASEMLTLYTLVIGFVMSRAWTNGYNQLVTLMQSRH